ncbi:MAG: phosphate ABC transporter permease subunit PstC, partial [Deltaproteobacteria bacterium]
MTAKAPRHWGDGAFRAMTFGFAAGIPLLFASIALCLWRESQPAVHKFGLGFLTSTAWDPVRDDFGALTAIAGTLGSTLLALLLAVPMSIGTAVFLAELAPAWLRAVFGVGIELLAAVPSIVYGMWGLFTLSPL